MRLLESSGGVIRLTRDLLVGEVPNYAILSHTWSPDGEEVTFRDLIDGTGTGKTGYDKIKFCAARAESDGLCYFWVDTCCIDKANSTELSEAINSMFEWYRKADRCYVYLSDVSTHGLTWEDQEPEPSWEAEFRASRWLTRGWTLQELLAPSSVEFFTVEGRRLGDKTSLQQHLHDVTGIAVAALQNTPLGHFSVEERFQWAANRNTTKEEDWVYCLLGIFGVYMPLIYGEGKKNAVRRLKREITEAANREESPEPPQDPLFDLGATSAQLEVQITNITGQQDGETAVADYDYSKADDGEIDLKEGESILNIEKSDDGWWTGTNSSGGRGLFPGNYVTMVDSDSTCPPTAPQTGNNYRPRRLRKLFSIWDRLTESSSEVQPATAANGSGVTGTALYDFEPVDDGGEIASLDPVSSES